MSKARDLHGGTLWGQAGEAHDVTEVDRNARVRLWLHRASSLQFVRHAPVPLFLLRYYYQDTRISKYMSKARLVKHSFCLHRVHCSVNTDNNFNTHYRMVNINDTLKWYVEYIKIWNGCLHLDLKAATNTSERLLIRLHYTLAKPGRGVHLTSFSQWSSSAFDLPLDPQGYWHTLPYETANYLTVSLQIYPLNEKKNSQRNHIISWSTNYPNVLPFNSRYYIFVHNL